VRERERVLQEGVLEGMLSKVQEQWRNAEFVLNNFKENKDVYILGGIEDVRPSPPSAPFPCLSVFPVAAFTPPATASLSPVCLCLHFKALRFSGLQHYS
jgi:hypothetical protein